MNSTTLRVLGPLELIGNGRVLDIGGPRQRVVLSMLALNANRVTSVDQLIDAVWDISPPHTARGQVHAAISALRKLFGGAGLSDAIQTRPPGYLLRIAGGGLDSEQFTSLVTRARAQVDGGKTVEAANTLREALALWRGRALADVHSDLVRRGAALLEDRRSAAIEERMRLELALGRHREISNELRALIGEHPLREELYRLLMVALYRSGRQAEALEVYRQARATLIEEVGIEPGPGLRDLERAILNRDRALDLPRSHAGAPAAGHELLATDLLRPDTGASGAERELLAADLLPRGTRVAAAGAEPVRAEPPMIERQPAPRQLPASISDLTGRQSVIAEIKQQLRAEQDPSRAPYAVRIVAISGKGGVGKSSLAVRAAHEVSTSFPDGQLYADLEGPNGDNGTAKLLARFLRALGVSGPAVPGDLRERIKLYRSRLAGRRMLVVLDGVSSEEQVLPLLPGGPACAVITTSRKRLSGLPGAYLVDIDVMTADQSVELLGKIIGVERVQAESGAATELVTFCGGLPLALRIAGARLVSRPHWSIRRLVHRLHDEASRLDELTHRGLELRSNIGLTYRGLDDRTERLFRLFALINAPDFPAWTAAALLDTDLATAEDLLEGLVDARLVDVVDHADTPCRYRFHELIRVYARERLMECETDAVRSRALGRLLGGWLALAEEAHRKEYGGDYTILHGHAARWRPRGGDAAALIGTAMNWWEAERPALVAAIRQAADAGLDELCWDLALTCVTLFEAKGHFDDWRETTVLAYDAAARAGNRAGQAAMLYSLGTLHVFQKRLDDAERCFTKALGIYEADGNVHGRALVLRNAALVDRLRGNSESMLTKYAGALAAMRLVGDRIGEAHILCSLAKVRMDEGDVDVAATMLDAAQGICQQVRCVRVEAQVLYRFAELYLVTDKIELARQMLHRVLLIVRDSGDRVGEAYTLHALGLVRHREGRLDNAEATQSHALALARQLGERLIEGQALYALAEIALARHDRATGAGRLAEARRIFDELGSRSWRAKSMILASQIRASGGDTTGSRAEIEQAAALLSGLGSKESERLRAKIDQALRVTR